MDVNKFNVGVTERRKELRNYDSESEIGPATFVRIMELYVTDNVWRNYLSKYTNCFNDRRNDRRIIRVQIRMGRVVGLIIFNLVKPIKIETIPLRSE